jgi:hypothetical protein
LRRCPSILSFAKNTPGYPGLDRFQVLVRAALQAIGMSPSQHAFQAILIEKGADPRKVFDIHTRNEAGFQRNAAYLELVRTALEVFQAMRFAGLGCCG